MGTTSDKLTYLNETKTQIKNNLNLGGANITNETFRQYASKLKDLLKSYLSNGLDTLWNNWTPKVNGTGEMITLNNTMKAPMSITYKGNTTQTGTPTPTNPINVNVVSGNNSIVVCGKNWFNKNATDLITNGRLDQQGKIAIDNDYYTSGFIKINPSTQYTKNSPSANAYHRVCFYSSADVNSFISRSESNTFTTPNNAYYLRFCGLNSEINTAQLELGNTTTTYQAYEGNTYPINLGSIELCKIGDYQDYIYKDSGKWYLHKEVGKITLNGSETWDNGYSVGTNYRYALTMNLGYIERATDNTLCDYFKCIINYTDDTPHYYLSSSNNTHFFFINKNKSDFTTWLSSNNVNVYYALATPTNTEITDTNLISNLEQVKYSYEGQTNIGQVNNDKAFILDITGLGGEV